MSHYKSQAHKRPIPICPKCGSVAKESDTTYGIRSTCCDLWSWDRYPLADKETHDARKAAHEAFDKLWKGPGHIMRRDTAYKYLQHELWLSESECHMKLMDKDTALMVPDAVKRIKAKLGHHDD